MHLTHRAWAEVDLCAISDNMKEIRRITNPNSKIMAMVKADGYGHGAVEIAKTVLENGADCLGVACTMEVCQLRNNGVKSQILIVGYTPERELISAIDADATITVFSLANATYVSEAAAYRGKNVKVHLKIDTGMNRIGLAYDNEDSLSIAEEICTLKNIEVEGIFSHLSCADESETAYTKEQYEKYMTFVHELEKKGIFIPVKHICNSAGMLMYPEMHLDMVRPGICIYGAYPSDDVDKSIITLKEAMTIKSTVARVVEAKKGTRISYGGTYEADKDIKLATIMAGYADGYHRSLSNRGRMIINNAYANVVGRICMDMCMADVTGIDVNPEDVAILMGRSGNLEISVEERAGLHDTASYEIYCDVGKRMPRIYVKDGETKSVLNYLM